MCGRYTLIKLADFIHVYPWIRPPEVIPPPRYNIAPTQPILAATNNGNSTLSLFHWGLVPSWAKDPSIGSRMINARSETLAEKPTFRRALQRRRCIIPASGFYEWKKEPDGKTKTPMYIRLKSHEPFAFAGLWEMWCADDGSELPTCTIITGPPNELMAPIHDRMPIILTPEAAGHWLEPAQRPSDQLLGLLKPFPADQMQATPVNRAVNNPRIDSRECIEPATTPPDAGIPPKKPKRGRDDVDQPGLFG